MDVWAGPAYQDPYSKASYNYLFLPFIQSYKAPNVVAAQLDQSNEVLQPAPESELESELQPELGLDLDLDLGSFNTTTPSQEVQSNLSCNKLNK